MALLLGIGGGCSSQKLATPQPPTGSQTLALAIEGAAGEQIGLHYGVDTALRVRLYVLETGLPVVDRPVRFSIFGDPAGSTLTSDSARTDASGVATVGLRAGQAEASFRVAVTASAAPELAYLVAISKLEFVEIDVQLTWSADPGPATLEALLYDDRRCSALPATAIAPAAARMLSRAEVSQATFGFSSLLDKPYALVGRAQDAAGHLLAYGCLDLGAELIPPGSSSMVSLPLAAVTAAPAVVYTLTSTLAPATGVSQPMIAPWQPYANCASGAAGSLLDLMAVPEARRAAKDSSGCRVATPGSLDVQLNDLLTAGSDPPAGHLHEVYLALTTLLQQVALISKLTLAPLGGERFAAMHQLDSATLATSDQKMSYDLVRFGRPLLEASGIDARFGGGTLELGAHTLTLGWGPLIGAGLCDLEIARRFPSLAQRCIRGLAEAVVAVASRSGKSGCAAVDDLVCGAAACPVPCATALDQLATQLEAPFVAHQADLHLTGQAQLIDVDGDLVCETLQGGRWQAPELAAGSFGGQKQ